MITSIGLIEFNAIASGIEATDAMLKAGRVNLSFAKPVCPGKYICLVHGEVGAVQNAMKAGLLTGGGRVVNHLIIPRVHASLIPAINAAVDVTEPGALGVVEYFDITSAVIAADAAAKASPITLIEVRLGMGIGGKSYFKLVGTVSDVKQAIAAATQATADRGLVVSQCVIPAPDPALFASLL